MLAIRCYDRFTSAGQVQFAGVALVVQGLVSIWAAEERSGWTFMTVACVGWALTLATYIRVLLANFAAWNWLVYIWGVMYGSFHWRLSGPITFQHARVSAAGRVSLCTSDQSLDHISPISIRTHLLPGSRSAWC